MLQLLQQIETMKELPEQIAGQLGKKEFLAATRGLTNSLQLLLLECLAMLNKLPETVESLGADLQNQLLQVMIMMMDDDDDNDDRIIMMI